MYIYIYIYIYICIYKYKIIRKTNYNIRVSNSCKAN